MKLDITKLPVLEGVIFFLLVAMAAGFTGAFLYTADDDEGAPNGNGEPTAAPTDGATTPPAGDTFDISMGDNFFEPKDVTVSAGASATFNVANDGAAIHNLRIAAADNEYDTGDDVLTELVMAAGAEDTITWTVPSEPGVYDFRCDYHWQVGMIGTITVQ